MYLDELFEYGVGEDWSQGVIMYNMEGACMMCIYILFIYSIGIYSWHFVHVNLPSLVTEAECDSLFHLQRVLFILSLALTLFDMIDD